MLNIKGLLTEFLQDESGLTAVEYAIAGGLVVTVMIVAFTELGENAGGRIQSLADTIGAPAAADPVVN